MKKRQWTALIMALALLLTLIPAAALSYAGTASERCPATRDGNHVWSSWQIEREATCTEQGYRFRNCSECGASEMKTYYADHRYGEWEVTVEATDHSAGTRERRCRVCGRVEKETFYPDGTLKRGDRGEEVEKLQQALFCNGYLEESGVDGQYGPGTAAAVAAAQKDAGDEPDGIAWPKCQTYIVHAFGAWQPVTPAGDFNDGLQTRTCSRCGLQEEEILPASPKYQRGDKGDGVKALQEALNAAGYDCGEPDGDFGGKTESAVKAVEAANGIDPDGIAWPGVIKLLGGGGMGGGEGGIGGGDGGALIALWVDPVPAGAYKVDETIETHGYVTNLTDHELTLDSITSVNPMDANIITSASMSATIAPHGSYPFTAQLFVLEGDISKEFGERVFRATATDPGTGESDEASCSVVVTILKNEPSIFLFFDWSERPDARVGETVALPFTVVNNGNADLKITDWKVGACENRFYPDEPVTIESSKMELFPVGDSFRATLYATARDFDADWAASEAGMGWSERDLKINARVLASGNGVDDSDYVYFGVTFDEDESDEEPDLWLEVIPDTDWTFFTSGETINYTLRLHNGSDADLIDARIEAYGENGGKRGEFNAESLPANDYVEFNDSYTFTDDDAAYGLITLSWVASAWEIDGEPVEAEPVLISYDVLYPDYDWEPPVTGRKPISVEKKETTERPDERGYTVNDVIGYDITVTNHMSWAMSTVEVTDPLKGMNEDAVVGIITDLQSGESRTVHFDYTVTSMDVVFPSLSNTATASAYTPLYNLPVTENSNTVTVPLYVDGGDDEIRIPEFTKEVVNLPSRGYFVESEIVDFLITIHNGTGADIHDVRVTDSLADPMDPMIGEFETIEAGETVTIHFYYTVTAYDAEHSPVHNEAYMEWFMEYPNTVFARPAGDEGYTLEPMGTLKAEADAPTGILPPVTNPPVTVPPVPPVTPAPPESGYSPLCIRDLVAVGQAREEYTLEYCVEHKPVQDKVDEIVRSASTQDEQLAAWEQAINIWTNELNEEYDKLLIGKNDDEKLSILNEKTMFFAAMVCRREELTMMFPDDPVKPVMLIAEQFMNRTVDLCYENHTAPADRVDGLTSAHEALSPAEPAHDCFREAELTDVGSRYFEYLCDEHVITEEKMLDIFNETEDATEAWAQIKAEWLKCLDVEIDALYAAASEEDRELIAADRVIYGQWLKAREEELAILYPDKPETVDEVIAMTVRARALDLCASITKPISAPKH